MTEFNHSYSNERSMGHDFHVGTEDMMITHKSQTFPGITEDDVHFHEPLLKNLLEDATQKIGDHMFRLKVSMEYKYRDEIETMKSFHQLTISEKDRIIHDLQSQLSELKVKSESERTQYEKEIENSTKVFEQATQLQEKRMFFLVWKHNAEEVALQKDMQELASNLTENTEKSKEYVTKLKVVHDSEKDDIITSLKAESDKITKEMIKKYEGELFFLTRELEVSRQHAHHERTLRQQLENELRQMFLKNMTSMNIEAFRIFQQAAVTRHEFDEALQQNLPTSPPAITSTPSHSTKLPSKNKDTSINTTRDLDTVASTSSEETSRAFEVVDMGSVFSSPGSIIYPGTMRR